MKLTDRRQLRRVRGRAARSYDRAAALPDEVGRRMLERLEVVRLPQGAILDAGSATGTITRLIARRFPRVPLYGMDPAPEMSSRARLALPVMRRALSAVSGTAPRWLAGDLDALPFAARRFALAWSNLAFQWLGEPAAAFSELKRVLVPGGLLMFSTLGPDTLKELRAAFAEVDDRTHVHGFPDMHDVGDQLVQAGFADPVMDMETIVLTYPSAEAMLRELREMGSTNLSPARARGFMGRSRWRRLLAALEARGRAGRIPATFEIVYGHAWKPEHGPGRTDDGRQVIRIHRSGRA